MTSPRPHFPPRGILFLSTEVYPYAKTGGLADVSSALPQALRELGHDVRVMMPKYGFIGEKKQKIHLINRLQGIEYKIGDREIVTNLKSSAILTSRTRIQMYLLESEEYFQRMGIYVDPITGTDYPDNDERFLVYALSAFELCRRLLWKPDIIHCNDWQCGLVAALLKGPFKDDPFFKNTKVVFTIHNLAFQGNFPATTFPKLGLPKEFFTPDGLEFFGKVSYLKAGIAYADAITTVSPTYAEEIRTPAFGCGMEGLLAKRKRDLYGILNGIDFYVWNPEHDTNIVRPFSVEDLDDKEECKKDLCFAMGIPYTKGTPVLGMIARLTDQKGFDLLAEIIDKILESGAQLVILGEGDKLYVDLFTRLQKKHPKQIGIYFGFHDNFAHKIEAGSDIFLMPSAYEPCGLNQMYSMHYGTIPVVRKTGGLADTVIDLEDATQRTHPTGFTFEKYDARAFWKAIERALRLYRKDKALWREMQITGMKKDFSWDRSALEYAQLYEKLLTHSTSDQKHEPHSPE
ncbi:MAG TPA: glycogen synthase GlgA [Candidatus Kapabacteria bacterium]|nr:glycogen synthase GlgA [Candidatus Kapabacteria bacterium]